MPSERDILYNFLIERSELENIITLKQFQRMLPSRIPEPAAKTLYKQLNKQNSKKHQMIEASINLRLTKAVQNKKLKVEKLKKNHSESSITEVNDKLEIVSALLDKELDDINEKYKNTLERLRELNDDLRGITYSRDTNEEMSFETIEQVVTSLTGFSETYNIE